jgi:transcriptional regulator with XRE-family HTH domain
VIRQKRIERGLTQEALAKRAGVTKNYVTMVERGTRKGVSPMIRAALADALDIPLRDVLTVDELGIFTVVQKATTRDMASAVVWQLERCLAERSAPTVPKTSAQLALRVLMQSQPDRRGELESMRSRLNELYP